VGTAARPARRVAARGGSGLSRYLTDLVAILAIAVLLNFVLSEAGMVNQLLRILIALIAGRVIVSLVRRRLDGRS
jgi:hypothetical protein